MRSLVAVLSISALTVLSAVLLWPQSAASQGGTVQVPLASGWKFIFP